MNIKHLVSFSAGLILGGACGFFGTKKYYQEKYQKRYEKDRNALEEYYQKVDEYARRSEEEKLDSDEEKAIMMEEECRPGGRMSKEERKKIKEKLGEKRKDPINYAGMYPYSWKEPEDEEENIDESTLEEEAFDEHQKNKDKPPKIISAETYSNLPAYIEQNVLYFYAYDEMLTDENEEPIDEPERLIGDALTKYDFVDSDEMVIFVMNYAMDTCYEIQKLDASWTGSH